ncbi:mediator complex subunit 27-domain-containing protein [Aspergillus tetrazonus]
MAGSKFLVLGGTGPAGICLLRELVYRQHETIVYARNPSKIDDDLQSNEFLEIIKGEFVEDDLPTLSAAIARTKVVISLLGPNIIRMSNPTLFADIYKTLVFPLMREHGVRRIFAMGTPSISRPEDSWTLFTAVVIPIIRIFAHSAYANVRAIGDAFEQHADGLDWTVFRIAAIPGNHDEESWRTDREDADVFVGWVGEKGWTPSQKRGALARWLVDAAEGGADEWSSSSPSTSSTSNAWEMAASSRLPIVVPKMEHSPSVKVNELKIDKDTIMAEPNPTAAPNAAPEDDVEPVIDPELLETELQLVSSLAKLQKLEEMIHQLRTLLPERLLEPLAPIVHPKAAAAIGIPNSPQDLHQRLSQSACDGVREVEDFKALWRGEEMKAVWERVDTLINENAGRLLQSNGMWQCDYNQILQDIAKHDNLRKEQQRKAKEEQERAQLQSAEGGWKAIVDNYAQAGIPGMRVLPTKSDSSFAVLLPKVGLAFKVNAISSGQEGVPEFNVSSKSPSGEPSSRVETAVLACLNARPRKWDLKFLFGMISSYSNIFQTTCTRCGKMQDQAANLPTLRRPKTTEPQTDQPPTFEAYHATCI